MMRKTKRFGSRFQVLALVAAVACLAPWALGSAEAGARRQAPGASSKPAAQAKAAPSARGTSARPPARTHRGPTGSKLATTNAATLIVAPPRALEGGGVGLPAPEFIVRLATDRGETRELRSRNGKVTVPAGVYWLTGWNVTLADAEGRLWTARGGVLGMPPLQSRLGLPAGRTVQVPLAGPLGVSVVPVVRGRTAMFTLTFAGPLGDRCFEVSVDGRRPAHPHLKILDEAGNLVDRLRFSFGCSFLCRLSWRAPAGVSGIFRAVPEIDFGPFQVDPSPGATFEIAQNASDLDPLAEGRPAPDFTLPEVEALPPGGSVPLSSLRGQPVALNFFCGCAWCDGVAEAWAKKPLPAGAHLIAIWNDAESATPAGLRKFRQRTGFKGRILIDPDHVATLLYSSSECPKVWVIDAAGTIRHVSASRTAPAEQIVADATQALIAAHPAIAGADTDRGSN